MRDWILRVGGNGSFLVVAESGAPTLTKERAKATGFSNVARAERVGRGAFPSLPTLAELRDGVLCDLVIVSLRGGRNLEPLAAIATDHECGEEPGQWRALVERQRVAELLGDTQAEVLEGLVPWTGEHFGDSEGQVSCPDGAYALRPARLWPDGRSPPSGTLVGTGVYASLSGAEIGTSWELYPGMGLRSRRTLGERTFLAEVINSVSTVNPRGWHAQLFACVDDEQRPVFRGRWSWHESIDGAIAAAEALWDRARRTPAPEEPKLWRVGWGSNNGECPGHVDSAPMTLDEARAHASKLALGEGKSIKYFAEPISIDVAEIRKRAEEQHNTAVAQQARHEAEQFPQSAQMAGRVAERARETIVLIDALTVLARAVQRRDHVISAIAAAGGASLVERVSSELDRDAYTGESSELLTSLLRDCAPNPKRS